MATGVRPAIALPRPAVFPVRADRGGRQLRSAVAGVSAIGECCEIDGQPGAGGPLFAQAEILARVCSVRLRRIFTGRRGLRLKVTGIDLFSAGDVQGRGR
jgi:nitrite reductase (NADH) large subunit